MVDIPTLPTRVVAFRRTGDCAAWGKGVHHRWRAVRDATLLTVRWQAG